ncbi:MAG: A/G-specific adenine glycosylase [Bacteroidetes bacterium]|nr:A/G-specific adenine glycosylase [Bacteroidota bacterium]
MKPTFAQLLLKWNSEQNVRQMPWKGENDPYLVWLSEIILQQTRVEQGLPYFLRFKMAYPTVNQLAQAPEDEVMKMWQGLGYYSRARNLHGTAKHIAGELKGKFPSTFGEIKKLKGVGDYTAAAISSFVFGERQAVVDGNVIRVLARVFGIDTPYDTTAGKKQITALAQELIDENQPGAYNQAIMDFGATVCTPQAPKCPSCPLQQICVAYKDGRIAELPVKSKKLTIKDRHFNYLLIKNEKEILISKRTSKDIWKDLYELPLIETSTPLKRNISATVADYLVTGEFTIHSYSKPISQMLTHRKIHFRFIEVELADFKSFKMEGILKVKVQDLHKFAFPKTIHLFLGQNNLL